MDNDNNCTKCGGQLIWVEYSHLSRHKYDGTSEISCANEKCNRRVGRWCGKELAKGEVEPRYCNGGEHPTE